MIDLYLLIRVGTLPMVLAACGGASPTEIRKSIPVEDAGPTIFDTGMAPDVVPTVTPEAGAADCGVLEIGNLGESLADSGICDLAADQAGLKAAGLPPWQGVGTQLCGTLPGSGTMFSCGACPSGQRCLAVELCSSGAYFTGSCAP